MAKPFPFFPDKRSVCSVLFNFCGPAGPTSFSPVIMKGEYLFAVKEDQSVEIREIRVDRIVDGEAVISSGVVPDETVVIDGQLRLTPGAKVKVAAGESGAKEGASQGEGKRP